MEIYELAKQSADFVKSQLGDIGDTAIILGSGLGGFAKKLSEVKSVSYEQIPNFPVSTVFGHEGKLISGLLGDSKVLVMQGRFHYYEGYSMEQVTFPVRVMALLGIKNLIITNAAGGVDTSFNPGDLMLITDHIKFFDSSPLRGKNDERFGERFCDMSEVYSKELLAVARKAAEEIGGVREGVYFYMPGPSFETPAEIRAIRVLGANAVGMSSVPEAIVSVHSGIKVLGISCISNMAAGVLDRKLSHQEVIDTGKMVAEKFEKLLCKIIENI